MMPLLLLLWERGEAAMMRRPYLTLAVVLLAAVAFGATALIVPSVTDPEQSEQRGAEQQIEDLEYREHGDGIFVTCDAKIVDLRGECVPPRGKFREASCYADSMAAVAEGDLSCTGD
jgi:hypothetical protein